KALRSLYVKWTITLPDPNIPESSMFWFTNYAAWTLDVKFDKKRPLILRGKY
ncbi:MAG: hypothetical protein HC817_03925, partial [Saprospiraceae bacterium]|nr:hypothetical protein [Saprospiraceae bacterium]